MGRWAKIQKRGAPEWLWENHGKKTVSYWLRYRKADVKVPEQRLKSRYPEWTDAKREGQKIIDIARGHLRSDGKPVSLVRCEDLCNEIIKLKEGMAKDTYDQTELFYRLHIIPYLNDKCPYISGLNSTVWTEYKREKRLANPRVALFNHWKFFVMLGKYSFEKGLLPQKIRFEFDEEKEDFRKEGQVIPNDELVKIIDNASEIWRHRIIVGRFTGMRPGEVRKLKKQRFNLETGIVRLKKNDTKTRYPREFTIRSKEVLKILRKRAGGADSDFFFPAKADPLKPMGKGLKGWHAALRRAGITKDYTPHDLRHTFLTNEFKKPGANIALICFAAGLSIEEAQETYLHFKAEDTVHIAEDLARESSQFLTRTHH